MQPEKRKVKKYTWVILWTIVAIVVFNVFWIWVLSFIASSAFSQYQQAIFLSFLAVFAVPVFFIVRAMQRDNRDLYLQQPAQTFREKLDRNPILLFSACWIVISFLLFSFVGVGIPAVYTFIAGKKGDVIEVVQSTDTGRHSTCLGGRIRFENKPFYASSLCWSDYRLVHSLNPGDQVILTGPKTWAGIVVRNMKKVE